MANSPVCSIPDCGKTHLARGWCAMHYKRWRLYGDPRSVTIPTRQICAVQGCGRFVQGRGYCTNHYSRMMNHGDPLGGKTPDGDAERFINEVAFLYDGDDCLKWPYNHNGKGYGTLPYEGRKQYVHRIVCEHFNGPPPTAKHEAAHSCGHGRDGCISGNHLSWKTPVENAADRIGHGTHGRGEMSASAKLTESDVHQIRSLKDKLLQRELADKFGVSRGAISNIHNRRTWDWL